MKYAIISDVHGNVHALEAVLKDAKAERVDKYLLLGDYYRDFPWPNETAELIRALSPAVAIRGNNENYLVDLGGQDQSQWIHKQFMLSYWTYRYCTRENLEFLTSLPENARVTDGNDTIHLAHSRKIFYRIPKILPFHSSRFRVMMEEAPFSHGEYLTLAKNAVLSRPDALAEIQALPKGIYLFGHNHLQFHMEYEGKLFVNPGSCGSAADFDPAAPYTMLERVGDRWAVTERRVAYDMNAARIGLRRFAEAGLPQVWQDVFERQLTGARDCLSPFINHVAETGRRNGQAGFPVSNDVWDGAVETWSRKMQELSGNKL